MSKLSLETILSMEPLKMLEYLKEEFVHELPSPKTSQEFQQYNYLLSQLANSYAFLTSVYCASKVLVRQAKREKKTKDEVDDAIDRRDVIAEILDVIKFQYTAYSRMLSAQKQAEEELKMAGSM